MDTRTPAEHQRDNPISVEGGQQGLGAVRVNAETGEAEHLGVTRVTVRPGSAPAARSWTPCKDRAEDVAWKSRRSPRFAPVPGDERTRTDVGNAIRMGVLRRAAGGGFEQTGQSLSTAQGVQAPAPVQRQAPP